MKTALSFLAFVILVLAFFFAISGKRYLQIPANADHAGVTEISACLNCHGPDKVYPRKPVHPPKDECFKCHKKKRVKRGGSAPSQ